MGLTARDSGSTFVPPPAGTHLAICCQVIDLGLQYSKFYDKTYHKVLVAWELPDEPDTQGKPFLVYKRYTVSLHKNSGLRADLEAWRGRPFTEDEKKGFELKNIVGKPCMLSVTHRQADDGNTYADVAAVMATPKGTTVPKQITPAILFDIDEWDAAVFETFSDNLKKTLMNSEEYRKKHGMPVGATTNPAMSAKGVGANAPLPNHTDTMTEDDIPF